MFEQYVTLLANVSLTLTFVVGLIFGVAQVRAAARDRRERLTLETLDNFQSREFVELLQFITATEFPKTPQELHALPVREQVMFIQFAQQMESLGILVAENLINLDLVDKTLGSFVTTTWKKYKTVFALLRKDDPFLGEYFQWLAERIEERMRMSPRKPFHMMAAGRPVV
jgi:hypothetical protein